MKDKEKHKNVIIYKGLHSRTGKFFNKEIICINEIDVLKEDLELYVQLLEKKIQDKNIKRVINFEKYKITYPEIIKIFNIWYNRSISAKLAERNKMRGVNL